MQVEEDICKINSREKMSMPSNNPKKEIELNPSVQNSLEEIVKNEGFISHKMYKRMLSTDGGNYMGDLYEVEISGQTKDDTKEMHIFVKQTYQSDALKDFVNVSAAYKKEVFAYRELSKVFKLLQDAAGVPENEQYKMAKSYNGLNTDAIILENLTKLGFKTLYRMDVMPLKYAELSIREIAKFHGLSFVLQHTRNDYFNKTIKNITAPLKFGDAWKTFAEKLCETSAQNVDDTKVQTKIRDYKKNVISEIPKYFKGEKGLVKCLAHGDYRVNNVLVKYDEGEDETAVLPVDYQLMFYGSPMIDMFYFLILGTDREFRKRHLNHLKDLYHDSLTEFLQYFNLDVNRIYPKETYERDFKQCLEYGLMMAIYVMPMCFVQEGEVPKFGKDDLEDVHFKVDGRFNDRMKELIEDYTEWGIL